MKTQNPYWAAIRDWALKAAAIVGFGVTLALGGAFAQSLSPQAYNMFTAASWLFLMGLVLFAALRITWVAVLLGFLVGVFILTKFVAWAAAL